MVLVDLSLAVICFGPVQAGVPQPTRLEAAASALTAQPDAGGRTCYPALVGKDTPVGTFDMMVYSTEKSGYGGDIIQFAEYPNLIMAIHRVWTGRPWEKRLQRLASPNAKDRTTITHGCVNVMPEVYERLKSCCTRQTLVVRR